MWRVCSRSPGAGRCAGAGRRAARRRAAPAATAGRRAPATPGRRRGAAAGSRPPGVALADRRAQRGRVGVAGGDEAERLDARELQQAPPGVDGAACLLLVQPGELRLAAREAVLRDRVAAVRAVEEPLGELGARGGERVQAGAGTTSSVTRSIPWSSSQSRMSAVRVNVAGSTSWIATANASSPSRRMSHLAGVRRCERGPVAGGEPRERPVPRAVRDGGERRAREPVARPLVGGQPCDRMPRALGVRGAQEAGAPSRTSVAGPPSSTAITGSPLACASRTTWPKVSVRLGKRKMSALA